MRTCVYDSGALIAIDKRQFDALRRHQDRVREGYRIIVPAPVAAQVVREPKRQARVMLTLRGCQIVPFQQEDAPIVGMLLAKARRSDVVDGFVAVIAARATAPVITTDGGDIGHLLGTLGSRLPVFAP